VVTAGPGLTNALTALKNAQVAQSPVVLLAGATATALKERGALQDIDQLAVAAPHVKRLIAVRRVRDLAPGVHEAFRAAADGVPGPVLVECPADLLYPRPTVEAWYGLSASPGSDQGGGGVARWLLRWHLRRLLGGGSRTPDAVAPGAPPAPDALSLRRAAALLGTSRRPVLLLGSQAVQAGCPPEKLRQAVESLGVPVFLSGMARGLLGRDHPLMMRHRRNAALREADLVVLAGVPCDFRLGYGRAIHPEAKRIAANRSAADARLNSRPAVLSVSHPGLFLVQLAERADAGAGRWADWIRALRSRDRARIAEIEALAAQRTEWVNPLRLCQAIEAVLPDDSIIVADGGDFVGTAAYVISPRRPLSWLDPGPFGTLGVGAGFALGAKLHRPSAEVWILYGDGSAGFSLAEFDTFVRHGLGVIAVLGNDAAWTQIARAQTALLGDDVATVLRRTDYDRAAEGLGACGLRVERAEDLEPTLAQAQAVARQGHPVLVNVWLGKSDFRADSISL
jgi:acetolactate synthase-1/2/3 large subunit